MPVTKKAAPAKAAAPTKKVSTRSRVNSGTPIVGSADPQYVRLQALSFARSLYGDGTADTPVVTASKLVTQAKRLEDYINGGAAVGDDA